MNKETNLEIEEKLASALHILEDILTEWPDIDEKLGYKKGMVTKAYFEGVKALRECEGWKGFLE